MPVLALVLAIILFLLGIIGTILPLMPGVILIWGGMLLYGLLTGFPNLTLGFFILQGLAVLLVLIIDYVASLAGTKYFGGSKTAIWGAFLGLLAGLIFLGPAGIIFGPFLGALAGELLKNLPLKKALRSSFGSLLGILGGVFLKLFIEIIMIYWFFQKIIG